MEGQEFAPRPGWVTPQNQKPMIRANGRTFEFDPGMEFLKCINEVADTVGFKSTFYVWAQLAPGQPLAAIPDPSAAPATLASGMIVELRPHSEGA